MSTEGVVLASVATEADRVVKRQKTCSTKFTNVVDTLLAAVNESKSKLHNGNGESALTDLKQHITQLGISSELHDQTKQLHGAIAKLGKVIWPLHSGVLYVPLQDPPAQSLSLLAGTGKSLCVRHLQGQ